MKVRLNDLWKDYELIDCGNGLKLERFGNYTLIRPDISATNKAKLSYDEWKKLASAEFVETSKISGNWNRYKIIPETWNMAYSSDNNSIVGELSLTASKHIGVFPEQVLNWIFIEKMSEHFEKMQFLNLFAYTGLSSVAAAQFSERVTHIDSIKKIIDWAKRNVILSEKTNVRCIAEDAQKFVVREIKRNSKYHGIILDPPPIGIGANNEKWILEEMLDDFLVNINQVLEPKSFVIMNLYSHTINDKYTHKIVLKFFPKYKIDMCEKVYGISNYGNEIDHGYFIRLFKI
jgi:23S rRNA (cytosine1962-C5)-methyltransferase